MSTQIIFFVKSGKDGVLFCWHPNQSIYFSGHCQTSRGFEFLPWIWVLGSVLVRRLPRGQRGGGRGQSALYRSVFQALWLPCSRGRCSSVHRGPREPIAQSERGQARRRCGRRPTVLFGLTTLVSRARLHRPFFYTIIYQVGRRPPSPTSGRKGKGISFPPS